MESNQAKAKEDNNILNNLRLIRQGYGEDILVALLIRKDEIVLLKSRIVRELYINDNHNDTCDDGIRNKEGYFFLTRGTQSSLEEEANKVKIIAFSEMNTNREEGANKDLTELFKQLSEGGVNVIKRDKNTNQIQHITASQKTLLYSTTESHNDDELQTRYVVIPISSNENKNRIVVENYLSSISNPEKYFSLIERQNWIQTAINELRGKIDQNIDVIVPYADLLNKPILDSQGKETFLFDMRKERVKRDVKRLMSLTKAIAWLYQRQRRIIEEDGNRFLLSEPQDFKLAFYLFMNFFDLTYIGIDYRIMATFKKIQELEGQHTKEILVLGYPINYSDYVLRHLLQKACGIESVNTIKSYVNELKDKGLIDGIYLENIPKGYLIKTNRVSIGYQEGVRGYQLDTLDTLLTPYFDTLSERYGKDVSDETRKRWAEFNTFFDVFSQHLTPSNLTPSNQPEQEPVESLSNDLSKKGSSAIILCKLLDAALLRQKDLDVSLFEINLKAAGHDVSELDNVIEKGIKKGEWFYLKPGVLNLL